MGLMIRASFLFFSHHVYIFLLSIKVYKLYDPIFVLTGEGAGNIDGVVLSW